jgi:hypothetical protein
MNTTVIAIITIFIVIVYLNKNLILNVPIKIYDKSSSFIKKLSKKKTDLDVKKEEKNINMNLQEIIENIENQPKYNIYMTNAEKISAQEEENRLRNQIEKYKKELIDITSVNYEIGSDLNKNIDNFNTFQQKAINKIIEMYKNIKENKKITTNYNIRINELLEKEEKTKQEAMKIKQQLSEEKEIVLRKEIEDLSNEKKNIEEITQRIIDLGLDISDQTIAHQSSIVESTKAEKQAALAKLHKEAAEKSAKEAESFKNKAKAEAEAILAKTLLNTIKKQILNDKSKINDFINKERENKARIRDEARYEKEILEKLSRDLKDANKRVGEIEKEISKKQGDNMVLTYKEKIADVKKLGYRGGNTNCDMISTNLSYSGKINETNYGFDGKNNFIIISENISPKIKNKSFTIEFILKQNVLKDSKRSIIYSQGIEPQNYVLIYYKINKLSEKYFFEINYGNDIISYEVDENKYINQEHHYAITFNNNDKIMKLYINGEIKKIKKMNNIVDISGESYIGMSPIYENEFMNGEINKFLIFNNVRTDKEIINDGINEYIECPPKAIVYIPMIASNNIIYTRLVTDERLKNNAIIDEIFIRLEYAIKQKKIAQDKWNNRKQILIDKLKIYKENYEKNKANIKISKDDYAFNLNEQIKAEQELIKKENEVLKATRLNNTLKDEYNKAREEASTRLEILKLKDRLRSLDSSTRFLAAKELKILQEKAARLKLLEANEKTNRALLNLAMQKKQTELIKINRNIVDKGYVENVNLYPIPSSKYKPYEELYSKYPILQNNHILVFDTIDTAITVLNNFDTVSIDGHVGKIDWIPIKNKNVEYSYCLNSEIRKHNLIQEEPIKHICPASVAKKNKKCNEFNLDYGIIVIKDLMPKLEKPLLKKTLRKSGDDIEDTIIKYTTLEYDNNGDTKQISKLDIDCKSYVMNQFRLLRGYEDKYENQYTRLEKGFNDFYNKADQIGYQYTCKKINKEGETINKKTQLQNDGSGNNYFLDKHNVNCQTGLIKSFNLKTNDNKMNYDYDCFITGTKNCTNHITLFKSHGEELNDDKGHVKYLQEHDVKCPADKFLKSFNLETNDTNQIRYNYRCCNITQKGEISTGDIPDNFASEKIIYNGTFNGHSFIFNGRNNYFVIPEEHSPIFSNKPFTVEFSFLIIENKFTYIFSQGTLPANPVEDINKCCTFFGIAIRSSTSSKTKSINNKIFLTYGYKVWETVMEFIPNTNYHFAVTYDSKKNIKMYVNGLNVSFMFKNNWRDMSKTPELKFSHWPVGNKAIGPIYVGKLKNKIKENNYFIGELSMIRIWDIDRTENQIKNSINNNSIFTNNLLLYLPLNKTLNNIYINRKFYKGQSKFITNNKTITNTYEKNDINDKLLYSYFTDEYKDINRMIINENINIYPDYKITFYLTLYKSMPKNIYGNILQVSTTNGNCCKLGDRNPAIWVMPTTTRLMFTTGSRSIDSKDFNRFDSNIIIDKELIPDNEYFISFTRDGSKIKIKIVDLNSKEIYFNIEKIETKVINKLLSGTIKVSNDFNDYQPAKGIIKNLKYYQINKNKRVEDGRQQQAQEVLQNRKNELNKLNGGNLLLKGGNDNTKKNILKEKLIKIIQFEEELIDNTNKLNLIEENNILGKSLINVLLNENDYENNNLHIICKNNNIFINGSITINRNKKTWDYKDLIPENNFGKCNSNNKCSGSNIDPYCQGISQSLDNMENNGCNKYCNNPNNLIDYINVHGSDKDFYKYYRSDLGGCVNDICAFPSDSMCNNENYLQSCYTNCKEHKNFKIAKLSLKPVWNNNHNLGYTFFEVESSNEGQIKGYLTSNGEIFLETMKNNLGTITFNLQYIPRTQNNKLCINNFNKNLIKNNIIELKTKIKNLDDEIYQLKKQKGGLINKYNYQYVDMSRNQSSIFR